MFCLELEHVLPFTFRTCLVVRTLMNFNTGGWSWWFNVFDDLKLIVWIFANLSYGNVNISAAYSLADTRNVAFALGFVAAATAHLIQ